MSRKTSMVPRRKQSEDAPALVRLSAGVLTGKYVVYFGWDARGGGAYVVMSKVGLRHEAEGLYEVEPVLAFAKSDGSVFLGRPCDLDCPDAKQLLMDGDQEATFDHGHHAYVYANGLLSVDNRWRAAS